jgi:phosphohistidine phosphatase
VIWLLRHGDAADGSPDSERPLTHKGREQARVAGEALAALGVELETCLTSPKLRAADTAAIACEALGVEPRADERLAGGRFQPDDLAAGHAGHVLLVGHEPDFSDALRSFTGARVDIKKGGLAAMQDGVLVLLLRPRELRAIASAGQGQAR